MRPRETAAKRAPSRWFSSSGNESDVVVATRSRFSRNLADYPYPPAQPAESAEETDATIVSALLGSSDDVEGAIPGDLHTVVLSDLSDAEASYLRERRLLEPADCRNAMVAPDESLLFLIGGIDHLRMIAYEPGLAVGTTLWRLRQIDVALERTLHCAVAIDWGYLSTEIGNLGTAMRCSALMHLPALVESDRMDEVVSTVHNTGFELVPDSGLNPTESTGLRDNSGLYLLANRRTLGTDETAISAKLEEYATKLVHYERVARDELLSEKRIEESVHRALGVLRFARSLTASEAFALLSRLRIGAVAGLVRGVSVESVTSLFFLSQRCHVMLTMQSDDNKVTGEENINEARAELIRGILDAV